ncbi:MAG: hypothetical protein JWO82_4228 [Akkermansiaceae bacterium]|nr:hypothetical protein [Akkermansiaceae bacterium]
MQDDPTELPGLVNEAPEEQPPLILTGDGYALTITPEAEKMKAILLKCAEGIQIVDNDDGATWASDEVKNLARMRNLVEKSRKLAKEPVLRIGGDIDARAKEFVADIEKHEMRLKGLLGDYATRVEEKRKAAIAEERRLAAEAEAARIAEEKAAADAEAARLAALAATEVVVSDDDEIEAAEAYDRQVAAEAEAARLQNVRAERETVLVAATPATRTRPTEGVKFAPDFEVTDIHALLEHNVSLVELTPRRSKILDAIKLGMKGDTPPTIPGLKITMKPVVSTR